MSDKAENVQEKVESGDGTEKAKKCINCSSYFGPDKEKCPECDLPLTPIMNDLSEGMVIGEKYKIETLIGDGGMGKIYKATHKLMKRKVAIKMLHSGLVGQPATLARFKKEAQASSQLDHTNIVTTFDFGLTPDGRPYLVMDYLEGQSFADLLKTEKVLEPKRCLNLFIQLCGGFEHAHTKGIVHRDIKPSNILIIKDEKNNEIVKILDFGIAKQISKRNEKDNNGDESPDDLTVPGTVFGSPLYMSPEQVRGDSVDFKSDIYSLSCLLYQSLTGTPPYEADDSIDCMHLHLHNQPEPFNRRCPSAKIPDTLEKLVLKGLNKEPESRIESMAEFQRLLQDELTKLEQMGSSTIVPSTTSVEEKESESTEKETMAKKSNETGEKNATEVENDAEVAVKAEGEKKFEIDKDQILSWMIPIVVLVLLVAATSLSNVKIFDEAEAVKSEDSSKKSETKKTESKKTSSDEKDAGENTTEEDEKKPERDPLQLPIGKKNDKVSHYKALMEEGKLAFKKGDLKSAQNNFVEANKFGRENNFESKSYVDSFTWIGRTLLVAGQKKEAVPYLKWSVHKLESIYGKDSPAAIEVRADLRRALNND